MTPIPDQLKATAQELMALLGRNRKAIDQIDQRTISQAATRLLLISSTMKGESNDN